jgi:hypothetical protein
VVTRQARVRSRFKNFIQNRFGSDIDLVVGKNVVRTLRGAFYEDPTQLLRWLPQAVMDQPVRTSVYAVFAAEDYVHLGKNTKLRVGERLYTVQRLVEYRYRDTLVCVIAVIDP